MDRPPIFLRRPVLDWRESFLSYPAEGRGTYFIYSDINASYCSIHQFLEGGRGKPCVVANGNASGEGGAGACLAISYEARALGIKRGFSLRRAKAMVKDLVVYESCLPLYEIYAELFDRVLECIVPKSMVYRGSCDEVVIEFDPRKMYARPFWDVVHTSLDFLKEELGEESKVLCRPEQDKEIAEMPRWRQTVFAISYLIRDTMWKLLGLPLSIAVAPSISLSKSLIEVAKPKFVAGKRVYQTFHPAICFPAHAEEANQFLRSMPLIDLCGVREIAMRFKERVGISKVGEFQDYISLERGISISKNLHLGRVIWHMCHGRDEVLSGYLAAIRDKK